MVLGAWVEVVWSVLAGCGALAVCGALGGCGLLGCWVGAMNS